MVDFDKNAVVFNDVTCEQLSRFYKNRTTSKIAVSLKISINIMDYITNATKPSSNPKTEAYL